MSTADKRFHEQWLGMVRPSEGLVVSAAVLVDAQCAEEQPREAQCSTRSRRRFRSVSRSPPGASPGAHPGTVPMQHTVTSMPLSASNIVRRCG